MTVQTFIDGAQVNANQMMLIQEGVMSTREPTPLILTGSDVQLSVANGSAVMGGVWVSGATTADSIVASGNSTVLTAPLNDSSALAANTTWVTTALANITGSNTYVPSSVAITGLTIDGTSINAGGTFTALNANTMAVNNNTTNVATTAFVLGQRSTTVPPMNLTATIGVSKLFARQDHVHSSDTTKAPLVSPVFTGTPQAPTPLSTDVTTKLATTAFVQNIVASEAVYTPAAISLTGGSINGTAIATSTGSFSALTSQTMTAGDVSIHVASTTFTATAISTAIVPSNVAFTGGTINNVTFGATNPVTAKFTSLTDTGALINSVRVITAAGNITQLATDYFIVVNKTVAAATTLNLITPAIGTVLVVKDGKGDALINAVTIIPVSGLIDGQATFSINQNFGCTELIYTGSGWAIINSIVL